MDVKKYLCINPFQCLHTPNTPPKWDFPKTFVYEILAVILFFQTAKSEIFRLFFQRDGRPEKLELEIKKKRLHFAM